MQISTCGTKYVTTYNDLYISHAIYNPANASEPKTAEQYILLIFCQRLCYDHRVKYQYISSYSWGFYPNRGQEEMTFYTFLKLPRTTICIFHMSFIMLQRLVNPRLLNNIFCKYFVRGYKVTGLHTYKFNNLHCYNVTAKYFRLLNKTVEEYNLWIFCQRLCYEHRVKYQSNSLPSWCF